MPRGADHDRASIRMGMALDGLKQQNEFFREHRASLARDVVFPQFGEAGGAIRTIDQGQYC